MVRSEVCPSSRPEAMVVWTRAEIVMVEKIRDARDVLEK